jgi:hypothetical protein
MKFTVKRVQYMPRELEAGILYVAEQFDAVAHLCVCGCGAKIRTPLGATEWTLTDDLDGPTLRPSIGNWQKPCQSHYLITRGAVDWLPAWTPQQISAGRGAEEKRRRDYYDRPQPRVSLVRRAWRWLNARLNHAHDRT